MSSHFLLPCECGQTTPIQISQAGQTISCAACGRKLTVPTMRGIRELKPATVAPSNATTVRSWNQTRGLIFGTGAILIIVGVISLAINYPPYRDYSAVQPSQEQFAHSIEQIDAMTPSDMWEAWHLFSEHGLGEHENSIFVFARKQAQRHLNFLIAGGVMIALGVVLVIAPLLFPSRTKA